MNNPKTNQSNTAEMAMLRLAAIVESSDDAIIGKDLNGMVTSWNMGAEKIFGYTADEMVGTTITRLLPPDRQAEEDYILGKIRRGEQVDHFETVRQTKDGRLVDVSVTISPIMDAAGNIIGASKIARDITIRKAHQQEILRLSGLYAALSQINQAIVWTRDRDELFEKICRVLVELGRFSMAWIGLADTQTRRVLPIAHWGDETDYLSQVDIYMDERTEGQGPVGTAIREGNSYICNDFAQDPNTDPWTVLANRAGFRAMAAFPIRENGAVCGAVLVYSHEIGFFRDKEIALLEEAAGDVSFALDFLRQEEKRQLAEAAMRESDERYKALFDRSLDCVFLYDFDGKFLDANQAALDLLGYQRVDIATLTFASLLTEDQLPVAFQVTEEIQATGYQKHPAEFRLRAKDGRLVDVETQSSLIYREGKPFAIQGIARDLTERKQAAAALVESEKRFRELVQNMPIGLVAHGPDTAILFANPMASRLLGLTAEQMVGKRATDPVWHFVREDGSHMPPDEYPVNQALRAADGVLLDWIVGIRPLDGEDTTWLQCNGHLVRNRDGQIEQVVVTFADLTEHRRIEESNVRLATAVEQSAESIIITTTSGTIVYVNPAFETISGYTRAEVLGQNPRILKSSKYDAAVYSRIWAVLKSGETWQGHLTNIRKDGKPYEVEATISPVRDAAGTVVNYVAVQRDVTREVQLEAQFQQSQKMESVGRLAGGVAHDFNNMLQIILAYAEMSIDEVEPNERLYTNLQEIKQAALRSAALTRHLLAFARMQPTNPSILDLNDTVSAMLKMLQRLISEDIKLAWRPGKDLNQVRIDPSQIDQILANLCINARDAIAGNGEIIIETGNAKVDQTYCAIHAEVVPGDYVCLSVSDTGCGMDAETLEKIFEPFFTTKAVGKGTGLGLATVYGIVKQNHGFIYAYSEPGQGSVFKIYLPRTKDLTPESDAAGASPLLSDVHGETILLVEDEPALRDVYKACLDKLGYTVLTPETPQEALALATQHPDDIQLLLTDVVMPGMNGKELAEAIRRVKPSINVLYMSGYAADVIADHGVLDQDATFIAKPFSYSDLGLKVHDVLKTRTRKPPKQT